MKKFEVVQQIFHQQIPHKPAQESGLSFAPTNIALCKYWGKRDEELNLPLTSSLSVALPEKGALTNISMNTGQSDQIILNDQAIEKTSGFAQRTSAFLDLFRPNQDWFLDINIKMNLPVAAGLASSACGFASLVLALNDLFQWQLSQRYLSILARFGSGSASRSLWNGFVEWHVGVQPDGMDCFSEPLTFEWPGLYIGLLQISFAEKPVSSREAMKRTVNTSLLYQNWPRKVMQDLIIVKQALRSQNFSLLGGTAESNALAMHATMLNAWPPICYFLPETIANMHRIWDLRKEGLQVYFTQDAGPNLKLLFLEKDKETLMQLFPDLEIIRAFE
mgnify:CR=1 FL=1